MSWFTRLILSGIVMVIFASVYSRPEFREAIMMAIEMESKDYESDYDDYEDEGGYAYDDYDTDYDY